MSSEKNKGASALSGLNPTAKIALIIGIPLVLLVVIAVSIFGYVNSVRNEGIRQEAALVAQYQDNQNELSTYILQFNESLGIADRSSERLNTILSEAIKGRYDGNMEPGTNGSMFSAIAEAYPDLTASTESYEKVQDLVVSGRNAYKNKQSMLLDRIRVYETWSESGLVKSQVVNSLGFPSDRLEARVGQDVARGVDALDRMKTLVLVGEAIESYETGTTDSLIKPNEDF